MGLRQRRSVKGMLTLSGCQGFCTNGLGAGSLAILKEHICLMSAKRWLKCAGPTRHSASLKKLLGSFVSTTTRCGDAPMSLHLRSCTSGVERSKTRLRNFDFSKRKHPPQDDLRYQDLEMFGEIFLFSNRSFRESNTPFYLVN